MKFLATSLHQTTIPYKGYCTPNLKLACFVYYLNIIDTFAEKIMHASQSKLSKEIKNGIEILV